MNLNGAFKIVADAALSTRTALADRVVMLESLQAIAAEAASLRDWAAEIRTVLDAMHAADRAQMEFQSLLNPDQPPGRDGSRP